MTTYVSHFGSRPNLVDSRFALKTTDDQCCWADLWLAGIRTKPGDDELSSILSTLKLDDIQLGFGNFV